MFYFECECCTKLEPGTAAIAGTTDPPQGWAQVFDTRSTWFWNCPTCIAGRLAPADVEGEFLCRHYKART